MPAFVAGQVQRRPQFGAALHRQEDFRAQAGHHHLTCANCNLRETCLSGGVPDVDLDRVANIVYARRQVRRGEHLFSAGDEFKCLYAIRRGFFKTSLIDSRGREQVTGFFMNGELLGMDGLGDGRCQVHAIALQDSLVCTMPYLQIERVSQDVPALQRRLHAMLAREIVRNQGLMLLLGSMSADERLAAFLMNLSKRYLYRGYSGADFTLHMTRAEIGSYLGLELETVSRAFSRFHKRGLIDVKQKLVSILDRDGLAQVLESSGLITCADPIRL